MSMSKIYIKPSTVQEALRAARQHPGNFRFIAGGTDLMVNKYQGNATESVLIDITGIEELGLFQIEEDGSIIGSLVTLETIASDAAIARCFPALREAACTIATPVIRKTATVGGNLMCENRCSYFNQSEWWREAVGYCLKCDGDVCIATGGKKSCFSRFVSDTAPVLIALDSQITVEDEHGEKSFPLENLYTGNGVLPRILNTAAIIRKITIPWSAGRRTVFRKLRPRGSMDFTSLTTAVSFDGENRLRIAIGGVDPGPVVAEGRLEKASELMNNVSRRSRVVDNDFYSRAYRREMIRVFLQQSYRELGII